jgi:hypothetical protein
VNKTLTITLPNRRTVVRTTVSLVGIGAMLLGLTACPGQTAEEKARSQEQSASGTAPGTVTLEKKNLAEKKRREENPNAIQYVYLVSFGKVMGYYVTKGKISNNGSQAGPEDAITWTCRKGDCMPVVVDSAQDDGSYGEGDPGIFFFTTEGIKVVTDLDYMQSDQPLPFNVPKLNPAKS